MDISIIGVMVVVLLGVIRMAFLFVSIANKRKGDPFRPTFLTRGLLQTITKKMSSRE